MMNEYLASLPWEDLRGNLSDSNLLTMASVDVWKEECVPKFAAEDYPIGTGIFGIAIVNHSNWELIDQPSGVCTDTLSCAFHRCDWYPIPLVDILADGDYYSLLVPNATVNVHLGEAGYVDFDAIPDELWTLPFAVVHPTQPHEIQAAIDFAHTHKMTLAVKTTGHSYSGSSTEHEALLLNMRRYPHYASDFTNESLLECTTNTDDEGAGGGEEEEDASEDTVVFTTRELRQNQACAVARSRNRSAILRVGGGEVWGDVYAAVHNWNNATALAEGGDYRYTIVGGSAGTVSATGGYMAQTGLSGNSGGRHFGFACDQVVQMEMVLPTGQFVRFGPTEWTEPTKQDGETETPVFPQTSKVSGWCNDDPSDPEDQWVWRECDPEVDDIAVSFDDLWHAVRGGGSGYGVITSVEYQLNDYPGKIYFYDAGMPENWTDWKVAVCGDCLDVDAMLQEIWINFLIDAYWNPSAVNISATNSSLCGGNGNWPLLFGGGTKGNLDVWCFADGGQAYVDAWQRVVLANNTVTQMLVDANFTQEMINAVADFISPTINDGIVNYYNGSLPDLYFMAMHTWPLIYFNPGVPAGKMMDSPAPYTANMPRVDGLIVPKSFLLDHRDISVPWLTAQGHFQAEGLTDGMYMLGAAMSRNYDGTTATNSHYREGAFHCAFFPAGNPDFLKHRRTLYEYVYGDGTPTENLPALSEYNHMNPQLYGPLKTNWSEPCPFLSQNFTSEQRDEACVPVLESIFGTEGLTKLESIKSAADPAHLFNSWGNVGYRERTRTIVASPSSSVPTQEKDVADNTTTISTSPPQDATDTLLQTTPTECSAYEACAGLDGACCPDKEGEFLTCCAGIPNGEEESPDGDATGADATTATTDDAVVTEPTASDGITPEDDANTTSITDPDPDDEASEPTASDGIIPEDDADTTTSITTVGSSDTTSITTVGSVAIVMVVTVAAVLAM